MGLLSLDFTLLITASLILYYALSAGQWRRMVITLTSIVFVASYATKWDDTAGLLQSVASLSGILSFALIGFLFQHHSPSVSGRSYVLMIVVLLCGFVFLKHVVQSLPVFAGTAALTTIGLSYILFRVLHLVVDRRNGAIAAPLSVGSCFAYLFCWPSFLSGPIWRYQDYVHQMDKLQYVKMDRDTVFAAFSRISSGCFKIAAMGEVALSLHTQFALYLELEDVLFSTSESMTLGTMYGFAALTYLLYMYFDFSGYMDVVIGIGRLFGLAVPENFNRPFSSADVLDFWNRWHMTLSKWMQEYFFTPLMASLTRWIGTKERTPYLGACGYFATFFIIGLWHGFGVRFALWGVALGFLASVTKLWDTWLTKIAGKKRAKQVKANRLYVASLGAASIFGIAVALSCTWLVPTTISQVDLQFVAAALLVGVPSAVCLAAGESLMVWLGDSYRKTECRRTRSAALKYAAAELWVAVKWFVAVGIILMQGEQMPAFVYQGF